MAGIYKITSPTKKIYVGSSINIKNRWRAYKNLKCKSQRKLYSSFLKYGVENHLFEIITECELEDMLKLETHWGLFYNVLDKEAGLNLVLPKDGDVYGGFAIDMAFNAGRFKKGQASPRKGVPMNEEHKERLRLINTGKPTWNKGTKGLCVAWNKGIACRESTKKLLSNAKKGKPSGRKGISTGIIPHNAKLVLCLNTGVFYYSSTDAARIYGFVRSTLNNMLDGKIKNKTSLCYV